MPSGKKPHFSDIEMEEIECGKVKEKGIEREKGVQKTLAFDLRSTSRKDELFQWHGKSGNENLEQGDCKLNNTSEKVYRLLEAHFTPLRQECIVQDPGPAEYKGPAEHKGTTGDMQQEESHFISKSGVNLLQIRSQNPGKYALALLDALFSNEEQSTCCYKASTKTNSSSVSHKPSLSPNRVKLLEDCIDKKFGKVRNIALSNPPHLKKSVRNCWSNPKRRLWCNGMPISWDHLKELYTKNRAQADDTGLALKFEHIHLTSYSKMRVDLAAQVLSNSVAKELLCLLAKRHRIYFAEIFDRFFDCLNSSSLSAGKRSRNPFRSPYRSGTDWKLKESLSFWEIEFVKTPWKTFLDNSDKEEEPTGIHHHLSSSTTLKRCALSLIHINATPLYWASWNGHHDVVQSLLAAGADVNKPCMPSGQGPLWIASFDGHLNVVKTLLAGGVNVNQASKQGK
eukprot:Em0024g200a